MSNTSCCSQSSCVSVTSNYSKVHNLLLSPFTTIKSSTPIKSRKISRLVTPLRRSILRNHSCSCTENPFSPGIYDGSFGLHINGNDFSPRMFEYKPDDEDSENLFGWNIDQMSKLHPIAISEENICCHSSPNVAQYLELREKAMKYFKENHHIPSPNTSSCLGYSKDLTRTPLTSKKLRNPNTSITLSGSRSICLYRRRSKSYTEIIPCTIDSGKTTPKLSRRILEIIQSPINKTSSKNQEENGNSSEVLLYFPDEDPNYNNEISLTEDTDDSFLELNSEEDCFNQKADLDISSIEYDSFRLNLEVSPISSNSKIDLNDLTEL
uniref:Protein aurora borealis n=1 Tax=Strongyloides stercoralis TaxID=6248 RepID=A0A0K0DUW4_STRER